MTQQKRLLEFFTWVKQWCPGLLPQYFLKFKPDKTETYQNVKKVLKIYNWLLFSVTFRRRKCNYEESGGLPLSDIVHPCMPLISYRPWLFLTTLNRSYYHCYYLHERNSPSDMMRQRVKRQFGVMQGEVQLRVKSNHELIWWKLMG